MGKDDNSIPDWQEAPFSQEESSEPEHSQQAADDGIPDLPYTEVEEMPPIPSREEAKAFLEHPGTKEADLEDKIRFLEMKNVQREDIEALLPESKARFAMQDEKEQRELDRNAGPASIPTSVAPVVTYPEFLVKSKKPPPLVTVNGVVNTIYATAATVTGMYALSKYYLNPMHEELSAARHDFYGHTQEKMDDLNGRLAKLTTVPPPANPSQLKDDKSDDGSESDASDPTELFHRDIGVQTSPPISRNHSTWSLDDIDQSTSTAILASQESKIASITSSLRDLKFSNDIAANEERKLAAEIDAFDKYLNELSLTSPYYKYQSAFPTWSSSSSTPPSAQDEIERFKSEIRSMKGALLSTRNFPRSSTTT